MEKTVIITGANSGIGKSAAWQFASGGYRVIMACRNIRNSLPVLEEIKRKTGNEKVELFQLDLSSKQSIYSFCDKYKQKYDVLDILINNAGHFKHGETSFQQSVDGMELTFATNLLGPVLLTRLLLDVLAKSEHPKVLNACSTNIKHFFDERRTIDFTSLAGKPVAGKRYRSYHLYGDSKIGLLMATFAMAREYKSYGISVNAIMIPATKLSKETIKKVKSYWRFLAVIQQPFAFDIEEIGNAYVSICTSHRYDKVTGELINHRGQIVTMASQSMPLVKIMTSTQVYPPYVQDKEAGNKIWEVCNSFS